MRPLPVALLSVLLAVSAQPSVGALPALAVAQEPVDQDAASGRDLLVRSFEGPSLAIEGNVAVVVLDDRGPFVSELHLSSTSAGQIAVGRGRSFRVGRDHDEAFLLRDGTLLRLGGVIADDEQLPSLLANYDVRVVPASEFDTGIADGLDLFDGRGVRRERLWIDRRSSAVVRRETYDLEGRIRRLVAFTDVIMVAPGLTDQRFAPSDEATAGPISELDLAALATLAKTGWHVPAELPGGFRLRRGFALDNGGDRSSLHLVYSDGLYALSLYQQPGTVAEVAIRGALWQQEGDRGVWRWPGSQPERLVWTAEGMTFTAVADATSDHLLASLAPLPHGQRDHPASRLRRGVARIASWLNPFG